MKKEIAEKLADALESGEYKQGYNRLRGGDNYCCLGVLCDLAVKEGVVDGWSPSGLADGFGRTVYQVETQSTFLPQKVQEWAGMFDDAGWMSSRPLDTLADDYESLSQANDALRPFGDIADFVRNYYEIL